MTTGYTILFWIFVIVLFSTRQDVSILSEKIIKLEYSIKKEKEKKDDK